MTIMKASLAAAILAAGALLAPGCATKKYVQATEAPIQAKADQASQQGTQNATQIKTTQDQLKELDEKTATGIHGDPEVPAAASLQIAPEPVPLAEVESAWNRVEKGRRIDFTV